MTQLKELREGLIQNNDFSLSLEFLTELFELGNIHDHSSIQKLLKLGGTRALERALKTSCKTGINTEDNQQITTRQELYGKNIRIDKPPVTLWDIVLQNFQDLTLRILCVAAVVSLVLGIATEGLDDGWFEGVSILLAVIAVVSVASFNNYVKEQQFRKLVQQSQAKSCMVLRNRELQNISVYQLFVGDIVKIERGQILSVDGIAVEANQLELDQSDMTGESDLILKTVVEQGKNPFLISGTKIAQGSGMMMVLAVGQNSFNGKIKKTLQTKKDETPLQEKLEVLADQIGQMGILAATLTFSVLLLHFVYDRWNQPCVLFCQAGLKKIVDYFIIAVSLIVMAVPEGLPLAVTIALAYSVGKMKDQNNLVRYLQACQTMGGANNICTDKTGTLTKNQMTVTRIFSQGNVYQKLQKRKISQATIKRLCEAVCVNSNADPVFGAAGIVQQIGNKTECALLEMAYQAGYDYTRYRDSHNRVRVIPFSSLSKRMSTIYSDGKQLYLFTKGAPQLMYQQCKFIMDQNGKKQQFTKQKLKQLQDARVEFCQDSLRTILVAYRPVSTEEIQDKDPVNNMIILALVGIKDPLRIQVTDAVASCKRAGITVRMCTGDVRETAISIARQCGILPSEYKGAPQSSRGQYIVLEGKSFRELVGGIVKNPEGKDVVKDIQTFKKIASQLRVLCRSSPFDKYILATGLKQLGEVVAMTGDGGNDAMALKKADIGFAMGINGVEIAKQAAGIILLDDNFKSIVSAVKYGRNIFDCIRKFLQYQLTINIVAIVMAFVGSAFLKDSPLTAVQMLWINLIMDTLASLALATESPNDALLQRLPYSRYENIITTSMNRFVTFQGLWQVFVLLIVLFYGDVLFGVATNVGSQQWNMQNGYHFTLFFNVFVFLQVFNFINARSLDPLNDLSLQNIFQNKIFVIIVVSIFILQLIIVQYGGQAFKLTPLSLTQHLVCIAIGSTSIIWNWVSKCILPQSCVNSLTFFNIKERPDHFDVDSKLLKILKRPSTYLRSKKRRSEIDD